MNVLRKVSVRELQHNLASYLELAKISPISITKHGKDEVVMINPKKFKITKAVSDKKPKKDIRSLGFFGMYKNRKGWKGKSAVEIAEDLRYRATYGK
jgi:hypothetical protein